MVSSIAFLALAEGDLAVNSWFILIYELRILSSWGYEVADVEVILESSRGLYISAPSDRFTIGPQA